MSTTTTGLPELPEGWFYRITKFNYSGDKYTLRVTVRKRRKYLPSKALGDSLSVHTEFGIREAAATALAKARRVSDWPDRKRFLGDYPPKSLNEATS